MNEDEMKKTIAFLFKRLGKRRSGFSELYLSISIDLRWGSVSQAKKFVNTALKKGFLVKKNHSLIPNFPIDNENIPIGFKPSLEGYNTKDENERDVLLEITERIVDIERVPLEEAIERINNIEKRKNVTREVAAVLYGYLNGLKFSENDLEKVQNSI